MSASGVIMSVFSDTEIEYLQHRATRWSEYNALIGRLATVGPDGTPHVVPLGVTYDPTTDAIVISGHAGTNMAASKKFRDAQRNPGVAIVIDDLESVHPWTPRFIEIRGSAETFSEGGEEEGRRLAEPLPWDPAWIRIRPRRIVTLGITGPYEFTARDVGQDPVSWPAMG
jgi:pyridoxamine 5'-phosphate oxidase family protein